jgi:hypothetical protein
VGQWRAGERDHSPGCAGAQEGEHDAAAQRKEQEERGGEDGVLPGLGECAGEGDGGAEDSPDRGWARAVEERAGPAVAAETVEVAGAEQHERE